MTAAALALGGNLDDPRAHLREAVAGLSDHPDVVVTAVSSLWRTEAVGGPAQPDYLNAVVLVETTLDSRGLLEFAHTLEERAGRVREARWGPRTLDVDLLDVDGQRSDDPQLTLPHPRAHQRAFVMVPWAEVAPDSVLSPAGTEPRTVGQWAASITGQRGTLLEEGPWWR